MPGGEVCGNPAMFTAATLKISRSKGGPAIQRVIARPNRSPRTRRLTKVVVLCSGATASAPPEADDSLRTCHRPLLEHGLAVLRVHRFSTGTPGNQFTNFYSTYNRTELQDRVRDLLTVCAALARGRTRTKAVPSDSVGPRAGPVSGPCWPHLRPMPSSPIAINWMLLPTRRCSRPICSVPASETSARSKVRPCWPRRIPLLLHNTGDKFPTDAIRATYRALGASKNLANRIPQVER